MRRLGNNIMRFSKYRKNKPEAEPLPEDTELDKGPDSWKRVVLKSSVAPILGLVCVNNLLPFNMMTLAFSTTYLLGAQIQQNQHTLGALNSQDKKHATSRIQNLQKMSVLSLVSGIAAPVLINLNPVFSGLCLGGVVGANLGSLFLEMEYDKQSSGKIEFSLLEKLVARGIMNILGFVVIYWYAQSNKERFLKGISRQIQAQQGKSSSDSS